jgi:long-chain acyl-CoA synthetase
VVNEDLEDVPPGQQGEILIKGPTVTAGYWQNADANREAFHLGYLRTGDVRKIDRGGWFYVVDRLKDIINAAGYKVAPTEVEECLCRHPDVVEAAVVGIPDHYRGETVKAYVTVRDQATLTPTELISFCRDRMASYKYPRVVEIVDQLSRTASGKVLRRELRRHG